MAHCVVEVRRCQDGGSRQGSCGFTHLLRAATIAEAYLVHPSNACIGPRDPQSQEVISAIVWRNWISKNQQPSVREKSIGPGDELPNHQPLSR